MADEVGDGGVDGRIEYWKKRYVLFKFMWLEILYIANFLNIISEYYFSQII